MGIRTMFGYVQKSVRNYGVPATLHDLECRLANKAGFFQILRAMRFRLEDVRDPRLFDAPGFYARFVDDDELWDLAQDPEYQMSPAFLNLALARGDRCYGVFDGRVLAAYGWYSGLQTPLTDEHFVLHFDRAWMYTYKGYTMPEYRGQRLHAFRICHALREITEAGKTGLISCVASNNFPSLRSCERMGYRTFGDIWLLRAAGKSMAHATQGCGEYGLRVEVRDAPHEPAGMTEFSGQRGWVSAQARKARLSPKERQRQVRR